MADVPDVISEDAAEAEFAAAANDFDEGAAAGAGEGDAGEGEGAAAGEGEGAAGEGEGEGDAEGASAGAGEGDAGEGEGEGASAGEGEGEGAAAGAGEGEGAAAGAAGDAEGAGAGEGAAVEPTVVDTTLFGVLASAADGAAAEAAIIEQFGDVEFPDPDREDGSETSTLRELMESYPQVFKPVAHLLSQVTKSINQAVAPALEVAERQAQERYLGALSGAIARQFDRHADALEILAAPEFEAWYAKQPAALKAVIDSVDPKNVAEAGEILDRYKRDAGVKVGKGGKGASPARAAARMAPRSAGGTAVPAKGAQDVVDEEAEFEAAAKSFSRRD